MNVLQVGCQACIAYRVRLESASNLLCPFNPGWLARRLKGERVREVASQPRETLLLIKSPSWWKHEQISSNFRNVPTHETNTCDGKDIGKSEANIVHVLLSINEFGVCAPKSVIPYDGRGLDIIQVTMPSLARNP